MTTGFSGSFAFNNVDLTLQPTTCTPKERTNYGFDGNAHPMYSSVRQYELKWDLISTSDAAQIINIYNTVGNTGTVVSCLPDWGNANFVFRNYSGTTLEEPTVGEYFQGYISSVTLLVCNVRTN